MRNARPDPTDALARLLLTTASPAENTSRRGAASPDIPSHRTSKESEGTPWVAAELVITPVARRRAPRESPLPCAQSACRETDASAFLAHQDGYEQLHLACGLASLARRRRSSPAMGSGQPVSLRQCARTRRLPGPIHIDDDPLRSWTARTNHRETRTVCEKISPLAHRVRKASAAGGSCGVRETEKASSDEASGCAASRARKAPAHGVSRS
jgi:hypothetical protein